MKKYIAVLISLILAFSLVSCSEKDDKEAKKDESKSLETNRTSSSTSEKNTTKETTSAEKTSKVEELIPGTLSKDRSEKQENTLLSFDKEKIKQIEKRMKVSPNRNMDLYTYIPKEEDAVNFTNSNSSEELFSSIILKPFKPQQYHRTRNTYEWTNGEPITWSYDALTMLKGKNYFEEEIRVDDKLEISNRWHNEAEGLYYKKTRTSEDGSTDETGNIIYSSASFEVTNYSLIPEYAPSFNPFILTPDEKLIFACVTAENDKPFIYLEILGTEEFKKEWIDIATGIITKSEKYNEKGELKELSKVEKWELADVAIDYVPSYYDHNEYLDTTLMTMTLKDKLDPSIPEFFEAIRKSIYDYNDESTGEFTGIELKSDNTQYSLYYQFTTESINSISIIDPVYVYTDFEDRKVRTMYRDKFYTICDEEESFTAYDYSCDRKKFFDLMSTVYLGQKNEGNTKEYLYYDLSNYDISRTHDVYGYVIEDSTLKEIRLYHVESFLNADTSKPAQTFTLKYIDYDDSVYDESFMENYSPENIYVEGEIYKGL